MSGKVKPVVLKGFRDYLPEVELPRRAMLDTIANVFESFGFGPLTTPAIEYSEVLLGKYGDEGEKLLYRFQDNGERDVALRYDLTVPLARVIGANQGLPLPFRRYQIAPVWRAEKPGRGRFREFVQCDVDIVGEASIRADAECMLVGLAVLKALGVPRYRMRVNNRKILDGVLDIVGVDGREARHGVLRAIDKLDKIGRAGVEAEIAREVGLDAAATTQLLDTLARPLSTAAEVGALREELSGSEVGLVGIDELEALLAIVEGAGESAHVDVDLTIARGLDYYTGTIYETFLVGHENFGSVMSGGRYDTLLGMFRTTDVPAVGISLGVDRLYAALLELEIVKASPRAADVFVVLFDEADYPGLIRVAQALRAHGVKSELSLKPAKLGKQFKLAQRKGYRFVMLAGADELKRGEVAIKDLEASEQKSYQLADIADWASELLA